jgi:hypothetical protein
VKRAELEHLIRASADIADDDEIVIVGSQAVLGQFPDPPPELCVSVEADLYPRNKPERADLIDGSIGEGSPFHDTYGYYAQGVGEATAVLPRGWRDRLVPIRNPNTRGATGWCLEVHDLVISKCVAGREKDLRFLEVAARQGLVDRATLQARLSETELAPELRTIITARIDRAFAAPIGRPRPG